MATHALFRILVVLMSGITSDSTETIGVCSATHNTILSYDIRLDITRACDISGSLFAHVIVGHSGILCEFYHIESSDPQNCCADPLWNKRFVFDPVGRRCTVFQVLRPWWYPLRSHTSWGLRAVQDENKYIAELVATLLRQEASCETETTSGTHLAASRVFGDLIRPIADAGDTDTHELHIHAPGYSEVVRYALNPCEDRGPGRDIGETLVSVYPQGVDLRVSFCPGATEISQTVLRAGEAALIKATCLSYEEIPYSSVEPFSREGAKAFRLNNEFARAQDWLMDYAIATMDSSQDDNAYHRLLLNVPDHRRLAQNYGVGFSLQIADAILGCACRTGKTGLARRVFADQIHLLADTNDPIPLLGYLQYYSRNHPSIGCSLLDDETAKEVTRITESWQSPQREAICAAVQRLMNHDADDSPFASSQTRPVFLFDRAYTVPQEGTSTAAMSRIQTQSFPIRSTANGIRESTIPMRMQERHKMPSADTIQTWMRVLHESFPNRPPGECEFAQKCLGDVLQMTGAEPNDRQTREVSQEIDRLARVWQRYRGKETFLSCVYTLQVEIYWYLTQPSWDEAQKAELDRQHGEIERMIAALPERVIREFAAPPELRKEITSVFQLGMNDFKSYASSSFLRFSQVPLSPSDFETLKAAIESDVIGYGQQLTKELAETAAVWRAEQSRRKPGVFPWWRRSSPDSLFERQLALLKGHATFMCGAAMSELEQHTMRGLYNASKARLFPFCQVGKWGTRYKIGTGWLFWAEPQVEVLQPQYGPDTLGSSREIR